MNQLKPITLLVLVALMFLLCIPVYSDEDPCAKGHTPDLEIGLCTVCNALTYLIGDIGPGGGKIFYRSTAGFTIQAGPGFSAYKVHYLEAAPNSWKGGTDDPAIVFAASNDEIQNLENIDENTYRDIGENRWQLSSTVMNRTIGQGRKNTAIIVQQYGSDAPAAKACVDYHGPKNKSDWFLPSIGELNELYKQGRRIGIRLIEYWYWSSSQHSTEGDNEAVWNQDFDYGTQSSHSKDAILNVRPIRAF
jgi:hypothetical protein